MAAVQSKLKLIICLQKGGVRPVRPVCRIWWISGTNTLWLKFIMQKTVCIWYNKCVWWRFFQENGAIDEKSKGCQRRLSGRGKASKIPQARCSCLDSKENDSPCCSTTPFVPIWRVRVWISRTCSMWWATPMWGSHWMSTPTPALTGQPNRWQKSLCSPLWQLEKSDQIRSWYYTNYYTICRWNCVEIRRFAWAAWQPPWKENVQKSVMPTA